MTLSAGGFSRLVEFFRAVPELGEAVGQAGFYVPPMVMLPTDEPYPVEFGPVDPSLSDIGGM